MTNLKKLLGSNIKIYRNNCGLSQAKLAECAGTATNYIAAIESGRRFPSLNIMEKIAMSLKIDVPELFSITLIPICTVKQELEEQIWKKINKELDVYIKKLVCEVKKKK